MRFDFFLLPWCMLGDFPPKITLNLGLTFHLYCLPFNKHFNVSCTAAVFIIIGFSICTPCSSSCFDFIVVYCLSLFTSSLLSSCRDFDASLYLCEEAFGVLPIDTLERLGGTLLLYPYALTLLLLSGTLAVAAIQNLRWVAAETGVEAGGSIWYLYYWNESNSWMSTLSYTPT